MAASKPRWYSAWSIWDCLWALKGSGAAFMVFISVTSILDKETASLDILGGQGYSIIKQQYDAGVASPLPRDGLVLNCNMISNAYFAIRISNGSMSRLPHALLCSKGYRHRSVNRRKKQDYGKVE